MEKKNYVDEFIHKLKIRQALMPEEEFRNDYELASCLTMEQTIKYLSWKYSVSIYNVIERCIDLGLPHQEEKKYENKFVGFVKRINKKIKKI